MTAQATIANPKDLFWRELGIDHLRARKPGVWRNPLGGPLATPDEAFGWLRSASEAWQAKDRRASVRLYSKGKARTLRAGDHPTAEDGSIAGYVRRLDATLGDAGLVVNNIQSADPEIWRRAQSVLASLAEVDGVRPGAAILDLFAGAYRSGFFGVHKDDQDVVTFVLEGKKRFLLWPYDYFADRPEVAPGSELKVVLLNELDYAPYREDAIAIEGEPGDVFCWPAEWWHVSESDGGLCTTLALGLFRDASPYRLVDQAAAELIEEGRAPLASTLPHPSLGERRGRASLTDLAGSLGRGLDAPELRDRIEEKALAHATAFGYFARPDPLPRAMALPATVRAPFPGGVAWAERDDGILLLSVGGAIFRYPAARPFVLLLERAASGARIDVDSTVAALAGDGTDVEPAALRYLLGLLHRHHALVAAD